MAELTLDDLVANRTLSAGMAALLAAATAERHSILNVAIPRMAGKSTLMDAVLAERPPEVPIYALGRRHGASLGIPESGATGGYLSFSEIASHSVTDAYLWGADVRQIFQNALDSGHAIATALHADGVESAFGVIAENEVTDEQAAQIKLVVYIRSLGEWSEPDRRAVAVLAEIDGIEDGRPAHRVIHRWDEGTDTFEQVAEPTLVTPEALAPYLERFGAASED
jgi:Flp pilus assembly CpaF family ATPase